MKLFVYNDWMQLNKFAYLMDASTFMCKCWVDGCVLYENNLNPLMVAQVDFEQGHNRVYGELYDVNDTYVKNMLSPLMTGCELEPVCYYAGERVYAHVSNGSKSVTKVISSGRWVPKELHLSV